MYQLTDNLVIGDLRHRVQILSPVEYQLESGGFITDWQCLGKIWAAIVPLSGKEFFAAKQVDYNLTHKIITRANKFDITSSFRIVHKREIFELSAKINVNHMDWQFILMAIQRTGTLKDYVLVNEDDNNFPFEWEDDGGPVFCGL